MKYINIFIASSVAAKKEAQHVADELGKYEMSDDVKINPICWWDDAKYSHILTNLIRQTNDCDFAAILLTADDLIIKDATKTALGPRDNCIFEAGLFAGALGPDFERCFLLVSVAPSNLPSDLGGIRYIDICEYGQGADDDVVNNKLTPITLN